MAAWKHKQAEMVEQQITEITHCVCAIDSIIDMYQENSDLGRALHMTRGLLELDISNKSKHAARLREGGGFVAALDGGEARQGSAGEAA